MPIPWKTHTPARSVIVESRDLTDKTENLPKSIRQPRMNWPAGQDFLMVESLIPIEMKKVEEVVIAIVTE